MLYVLNLGWQWFAGAGALGLAVGYATTTRERNGKFSGAWVIMLALAVLAGAAVAALQGVAPGHAGLTLEIGLLASLAYFFGLPLGGGFKGLLPAAAPAPGKPKPVVLRKTAPQARSAQPEPTARPEPEKRTSPSALVDDAVKHAAGKKQFPGQRPDSLPAARDGGPDDLTKIKGIGPKSVEKLHGLGVYHFDQIAAWNLDNAHWISAALAIPGRVERNKWIQQARDIVAHAAAEKESTP